MAGHAESKTQVVGAKDVARTARDDERGVKFLGMKPLKVVRLKKRQGGQDELPLLAKCWRRAEGVSHSA